MMLLRVQRAKDKSDMVKVGVNDRKLIWKEHMKRLINAENKWRNDIAASKVVSAVRRIDAGEVR